jgi:hypothetical protein
MSDSRVLYLPPWAPEPEWPGKSVHDPTHATAPRPKMSMTFETEQIRPLRHV